MGGHGRGPLLDMLVDLRRTMEALDEARVRVAGILNLPTDPLSMSGGDMDDTQHHHMMPFFGYHDCIDGQRLSRMRKKNRTSLDDAILKCLIS